MIVYCIGDGGTLPCNCGSTGCPSTCSPSNAWGNDGKPKPVPPRPPTNRHERRKALKQLRLNGSYPDAK